MEGPLSGDLIAGFSGFDLEGEEYDLGHGLILKPTYAHLMGGMMVAFSPAPPGEHHPAPWKMAQSSFGFDIHAELRIPKDFLGLSNDQRLGLMQVLVALMRLWVAPVIRIPVVSNIPFAVAKDSPDNEAYLHPVEWHGFEMPFVGIDSNLNPGSMDGVRDRWKIAFDLCQSNTAFHSALIALDEAQFSKSTSLTLVSFWGALEAIFLTDTRELRFRLAVLIASYMEPPGEMRDLLYRRVLKLYDHRSKAAHGRPKNDWEAFGQSFMLLRAVLIKIMAEGTMPTTAELEERMLGGVAPKA